MGKYHRRADIQGSPGTRTELTEAVSPSFKAYQIPLVVEASL